MLTVVLVIAIAAYVIGRQLLGEPLRGKRVILLPVILAVVGGTDLAHTHLHATTVDVTCLAISAVISVSIGLAQGAVLRIEQRDGYLWGQLPPKGLILWVALIVSRVTMLAVASGLHAHLAASSDTILLMLGINRLGQAAVVTLRAMTSGIPFAPEKDGRSFLPGLTAGNQ